MTRGTLFLRSCVLTLGLLAAMLAFDSNRASAQLFDCTCDSIVVSVGNDVGCRVVVCVRTFGPTVCDTLLPGSHNVFRCLGQAVVYITDCNGNIVPVTQACVDVPISNTCCVRACLGFDANKCPVVRITSTLCKCV